jgi:lauroyl/myristoyl acyltransferase
LRFEEPLAPIECENTGEAIRRNTRAYNAVLERVILRCPEQWYWVHRRWKAAASKPRKTRDAVT